MIICIIKTKQNKKYCPRHGDISLHYITLRLLKMSTLRIQAFSFTWNYTSIINRQDFQQCFVLSKLINVSNSLHPIYYYLKYFVNHKLLILNAILMHASKFINITKCYWTYFTFRVPPEMISFSSCFTFSWDINIISNSISSLQTKK